MPTLQPFHLERWFAEFEFLPGMKSLSASSPFATTTRELLALEGEETTTRYLNPGLEYVENPGSGTLRETIAHTVYTTVDTNAVRVTSGASEALFLLIWTRTEAGDNIVVESACYEHVTGVASSCNVEVRRLPLTVARLPSKSTSSSCRAISMEKPMTTLYASVSAVGHHNFKKG